MAQMRMSDIYKLMKILSQARNDVEEVVGDGKFVEFINDEAREIFFTLNDLCVKVAEMRDEWEIPKARRARNV